ncbi:MAG: CBS domain-containing protein [Tissierellia bacterium]|jgi:acetoin utilization protein AcuB|nr:CBS domain-containing protein [Tissierellia bacterium]HKM00537.1 CBS and ACT domain-containing protein [Sedimentibacter sp.]
MYVRNRMTKNPYTIAYDAPITDAVALLREKGLKRLPVVDGEKVVGILTQSDIHKVSPTKATSLSIFEINYLLSKLTVKDAMAKKAITIEVDSLLEEAAVIMRENRIGTLPVVDGGKLVGIITESDIFDAFIDLLGFKDNGSRITIEAKDVPGAMADIAEIFKSLGVNITHIAVFNGQGFRDVVIRSEALDTAGLEKKLSEQGYKVKHVLKSK